MLGCCMKDAGAAVEGPVGPSDAVLGQTPDAEDAEDAGVGD